MALSYCGYSLPIQTVEHALWLDQYYSFNNIKETGYVGWRGHNLLECVLPDPQPHAPIEIGVLRWPTGASEYGQFHCVVGSTTLDLIRAYIDANGQYQDLVMSDGNTDHTITASMKMLPARPIHQIDNTEQLYLLTLVDKRWDWRWKSADITSAPASWSTLYSTIGTAINETITPDTIDADYSTPSERWVQYRKPMPFLLDAAANCIQQRVVVALDGTVTTVNASTANTNATSAYADVVKLIGGEIDTDDIKRYVPASVTTVFGEKSGSTWADAPYTKNNTLTSLSITEYGAASGISGLTATIFADLVNDGTNDAACDALAAQAATDWYKWRLNNFDFVLPGIINWPITGAEDFVEWRYQDDGKLLTRVVVGPWQEITLGGFKKLESSGGSSSLTVQEVDGSPSVTSVTTLRVDQADGFVVSTPGAGIARIDQTAVSSTAVGYVNLSNQFLGQNQKGVEQMYIHPDPSSGFVYPVYLATGGVDGELQVWATDPGTLNPDKLLADGNLYCSALSVGSGAGGTGVATPGHGTFSGSVRCCQAVEAVTFPDDLPSVSITTTSTGGGALATLVGPALNFTEGPGTSADYHHSLVYVASIKSLVSLTYYGSVSSVDYTHKFLIVGANYAIDQGSGTLNGITNTLYPNATSTGGIITDRGTKASSVTDLTDSTGGTANNTLVAISGTGDDTNINNNFADLAAKINTILARMRTNNHIS